MENNPIDQKFLDDVTRLYNFHKEQLDKYFKILQILKTDNTPPQDTPLLKNAIITGEGEKIKRRTRKGGTFETKVVSLLNSGMPLSVTEIRDEINKQTGKSYSSKDISISLRSVKRTKHTLKNQLFPKYPFDFRSIWGLSGWFDGDKFSEEYLKKIKQRVEI